MTNNEIDSKISAHIESECNKFLEKCSKLKREQTGSPIMPHFIIEALKAGFYSDFKAGVLSVRDVDKII